LVVRVINSSSEAGRRMGVMKPGERKSREEEESWKVAEGNRESIPPSQKKPRDVSPNVVTPKATPATHPHKVQGPRDVLKLIASGIPISVPLHP